MSGAYFTRVNDKRLKVNLGAALTIGTGAVSYGVWLRLHAWYTGGGDWDDGLNVTNSDSSPNFGIGIKVGTSTTKLFLVGGTSGNLQTQFGELETNYWCAVTRDAGATVLRLRIFNEAGTVVYNQTSSCTRDFTMLQWIQFGNDGWGNLAANATWWDFKLQTGVEWSEAEAWTEAQTWLIQKAGGTDRHAFRLAALNDSTAGLHSCTSSALLTNSGAVAGASRPSCLEYDPLASDDFNRANETPLASPWAKIPGGWPGETNLTTNRAEGNASDGPQYHTGVTWPDDQWVEIVLPDVAGDYDASCLLRTGSGQGYTWTGFNLGPGPMGLLGTGAFGADLFNRDPALTTGNGDYVLRFEVQGTTFKCFKNGEQVGANITDATFASGAAGFFTYDSGGAVTAWAGGRFGVPVVGDPTRAPFRDLDGWRSTADHHTASRLDAPRFPGGLS